MYLENLNKDLFCLFKMIFFVGIRGFFFLIGIYDIWKLIEVFEV